MSTVDSAAAYASLVNAEFEGVLGRAADPAALAFWLQQAQSGEIRSSLASSLVDSDEYFADLVRNEYEQILGRAPDAAGLAFWTADLRGGLSGEQFETQLLASPESYANAGADAGDWVRSLYENVLGRGPDASSDAYWNAALAAGDDRLQVAASFTGSEESERRQVAGDFQRLLDRAADGAASAYFANQFAAGQTDQQIVVRLLDSDEYFTLHTGFATSVVPVPSPTDLALNPAIDARLRQGGAELLFVGDSITYGWQLSGQPVWNQYYAPQNAVNAGVPGDTTENVLWRLDHENLADIRPKLAIVEIGTNNLGANSPAEIAAGAAAIIETLHRQLPDAKILLLGILPRGLTPDDPFRFLSEAANRALQPLADDQTVFYLDLSPAFMRPDGTLDADLLFPDLVHPNATGYQAWAAAMAGVVDELLKS